LLGGLSVVASQGLWIRAENALAERRDADALAYLDLLTELTPQLVAASDHIADEIGANRAREFSDPDAKWSFVREGLRIHDRSVAQNPGVAEAFLARGRYLFLRIAPSEPMRTRFEAAGRGDAIETAIADLERARQLDPDSFEALEALGAALKLLGERQFFGDGDPAAAAVTLRRVARLYGAQLARLADAPEALETKTVLRDYAAGLAAVAEAAPDDREALYRDFQARFGRWFPDLPPLRSR
jgi:hypothetical protein